MKYYTFVGVQGNTLFHRYVENGERHIDIVKNYPYELFLRDDNGEFNSLYGEKLKRLEFDTVSDLKGFIAKTSKDKIYGNLSPVQQFIVNEYPEISVCESLYKIIVLDIETNHQDGLVYNDYDKISIKDNGKSKEVFFKDIKNTKGSYEVYDPFYRKILPFNESSLVDQNIGFPDTEKADVEILTISYKIIQNKKIIEMGCYGLNEYTGEFDNFKKFDSEADLIRGFINLFCDHQFDFISSWNGDDFDIPYFISRSKKVVGDKMTNKLSPFSAYIKNPIVVNKRAISFQYNIFGLTQWDYYQLYKKYAKKKQERYTLDYIAGEELGESKLDYSKYNNSLMNLYCGEYEIIDKSEIEDETDRWCYLRTLIKRKLDERLYNDKYIK